MPSDDRLDPKLAATLDVMNRLGSVTVKRTIFGDRWCPEGAGRQLTRLRLDRPVQAGRLRREVDGEVVRYTTKEAADFTTRTRHRDVPQHVVQAERVADAELDTRASIEERCSVQKHVVFLLLLGMTPSIEVAENAVHLVLEGHTAHAVDDEHHDTTGEHGCTGIFHACVCHASPLFVASEAGIVEPQTRPDAVPGHAGATQADGHGRALLRPPIT
ncbi:MAG: hypothetical protein RMA76_28840 [Deltaproteobacteria bacterium]|jgi:hypothetical protein